MHLCKYTWLFFVQCTVRNNCSCNHESLLSCSFSLLPSFLFQGGAAVQVTKAAKVHQTRWLSRSSVCKGDDKGTPCQSPRSATSSTQWMAWALALIPSRAIFINEKKKNSLTYSIVCLPRQTLLHSAPFCYFFFIILDPFSCRCIACAVERCVGANFHTEGEDPELKPDEEYPDWLWELPTR